MGGLLKIASGLALVATIVPSALYLGGRIGHAQANRVLLAATIAWFVLATWSQVRSTATKAERG